MFSISVETATILSIPATYATAYGFIFSYGKLLLALADSKLLPSVFLWKYKPTGAPYMALIAGSVLGYAICLVVNYYPELSLYLFNICMLCSFMGYLSQIYGFIQVQ